ncbi:MAG: 50S ribosomal protein L10 [Thermosynechococcaceae cyanobacterium MS004]|nr:50S ribosomal protein L10 [Thermosynechococcaceae cyanobacterium MS004]
MGRSPENKKAIVATLKAELETTQMSFVIDYQGLTVSEISDLRSRLRPLGASCKVTKNTLMRRAVDGNDAWQPLTEYMAGASAFVLVKEDSADLSAAIKAYYDFQKVTKKTELRGGVFEGRTLSQAEVKALGDLPPKEVLLAQIAGAINAVATKVAVGIKEVPTSIGRGIKAYAEKDAA